MPNFSSRSPLCPLSKAQRALCDPNWLFPLPGKPLRLLTTNLLFTAYSPGLEQLLTPNSEAGFPLLTNLQETKQKVP